MGLVLCGRGVFRDRLTIAPKFAIAAGPGPERSYFGRYAMQSISTFIGGAANFASTVVRAGLCVAEELGVDFVHGGEIFAVRPERRST